VTRCFKPIERTAKSGWDFLSRRRHGEFDNVLSMLEILLFLVAMLAGGVAALSGFGIGSLLTPFFAPHMGTKLAVAAVAVPHFLGTLYRLWLMRSSINRHVLLQFGLLSAVGGLIGAFLHAQLQSDSLTLVFGLLLMFVGLSGLTGLSKRLRFKGRAAWMAGALSGLLGGLVGNQGGIRSAAMLGFPISKEAFVATATAAGVIVDLARLPVYVVTEGDRLASLGSWLTIATLGVFAGTWLGTPLLRRLPEIVFTRLVSSLILVLGLYMLGRTIL
jgi:uncharacterized protein